VASADLRVRFSFGRNKFVQLLIRSRNSNDRFVRSLLTSFDIELPEARDAAQNRPFWRMLASYSATKHYGSNDGIGLDYNLHPKNGTGLFSKK